MFLTILKKNEIKQLRIQTDIEKKNLLSPEKSKSSYQSFQKNSKTKHSSSYTFPMPEADCEPHIVSAEEWVMYPTL